MDSPARSAVAAITGEVEPSTTLIQSNDSVESAEDGRTSVTIWVLKRESAVVQRILFCFSGFTRAKAY